MMILADSGSLTRCPECCSMRRGFDVGRAVRSTGALRERRCRWERVFIKCGVFIEALRSESSGRHVLEGFVDALGCARATNRDVSVKCWRRKVKMRIRVNHQIGFGEQMALLGSSESAGSWNNRVMMRWTEAGWVVDLEADPGEKIEYKYVIVQRNGNLWWENGANRVLIIPDDFSKNYQVVSHWSATSETVHFEGFDAFQAPQGEATRAGQEMTNQPYDLEVTEGTKSPEDGEAEAKKGLNDETGDFLVFDGTQFHEDGGAEAKAKAKAEGINETVDFKAMDGRIFPEDGATKARKAVTNDTVYSECIKGSRGAEGAVTELEQEKLKVDGSPPLNLENCECPDKKDSVIRGEEITPVRSIEVSRRRDTKGQDNSCKTPAEGDQSSICWWGKAAIFLVLLIMPGTIS